MSITTLVVFGSIFTLLALSLYRPKWGIIAYIVLYINYNPDAWWGGRVMRNIFFGSPSKVAFMFLVIGCIFNFKKLDWQISRREIELYLFLLVVWLVAYVFGLGINEETSYYLLKVSKSFIFLFFLFRVIHTLEDYDHLIWAFVLSGLFLSYLANVGAGTGRLDNIGGVDFREANAFANFIVFTAITVSFKLLNTRSIIRFIAFVFCIALMINSFILTQSRAVFLGFFFAGLFLLFKSPKKFRKKIFLFSGLALILFLNLMDFSFIERMKSIHEEAKNINQEMDIADSGNKPLTRLDFWATSIEIFEDHPLGIGIKNFEITVPLYDPRNHGLDAHNAYVLCYSEQGILGIALFLLIIIEAFLQFRRINRKALESPHYDQIITFSFSLNLSLIVLLLGTMIAHSFLYTEYVWILLSLPICLERSLDKVLLSQELEKES